jgi:hypothetical protein
MPGRGIFNPNKKGQNIMAKDYFDWDCGEGALSKREQARRRRAARKCGATFEYIEDRSGVIRYWFAVERSFDDPMKVVNAVQVELAKTATATKTG